MNEKERIPPKVVFSFCDEPKPGELEELIAKRDALMLKMGYLPPDETHEFWRKPGEDE